MLLIRMPKKDGCKGCLLGTFVFFRVIFTIWYALMGIMIYILMYFTVDIWINKTVKGKDLDAKVKIAPSVSDINTVTCTIIQIILCLVAAIHLLFLLCFPLVVCKYVSSHDDSFCKVLMARMKGFCTFWGKSIKGYYYPIAVVNEEEVTYVEEINLEERAKSNKEFQDKEAMAAFIEERRKTFDAFADVTCPGCEKEIEDGEEVVELDCNAGHTYHVACLEEQLKSSK